MAPWIQDVQILGNRNLGIYVAQKQYKIGYALLG